MNWITKTAVATALTLSFSATVSNAATIQECGNKSFSATQGSVDLLVPNAVGAPAGSICGDSGGSLGNSTGSNSLISAAGWTSGDEVQGGANEGASNEGDGKLTLTVGTNTWSILNTFGYSMLGLSIKHGNGYVFYVLDPDAALNGAWFTYDNTTAGSAFSHINAWYKGDPTTPVPLPAAGFLLIAGLGGLAAMRRRRKA